MRLEERADGSRVLLFECPGCGFLHGIRVQGEHPTWSWNRSLVSPTVAPSVLLTAEGLRCHFYLREGQVHFLGDCSHALVGQTVDLPLLEDSDGAA